MNNIKIRSSRLMFHWVSGGISKHYQLLTKLAISRKLNLKKWNQLPTLRINF